MLFTDPFFLFAFLPFTLAGFYLGRRYIGGSFAIWFLLAVSVFFYGYWSVKYLFLLLAQALVNFYLLQGRTRPVSREARQAPSLWSSVSARQPISTFICMASFLTGYTKAPRTARSSTLQTSPRRRNWTRSCSASSMR